METSTTLSRTFIFSGRRCVDDARQIKRWHNFAGANGRVKQSLVRQLRGRWNRSLGAKTRQALQHWAYELTEEDFLREINSPQKPPKPEEPRRRARGPRQSTLFEHFDAK